MKTEQLILKHLKIQKPELKKLSDDARKHYLMLTSMIFDIHIIHRLMFFANNDLMQYSHNVTQQPEHVKAAFASMQFLFLRILIAKTYEMREYIMNQKDMMDINNIPSAEAKEAIEEIHKYFSNKKIRRLFKFIRNKLSFHYEYEGKINEAVKKSFDKLDCFQMWLSEHDAGNELFPSTNFILNDIVLQEMKEIGFAVNDTNYLDELFDLAFKPVDLFTKFCKHYLIDVVIAKHDIVLDDMGSIRIPVPPFSDIRLPFFVKPPSSSMSNK